MPYQTASNPQTGEKLILIDGSWQKLDQSATNPKSGEKAYQVGGKWITESATPGQKTPQGASEKTQPWQYTAGEFLRRGLTSAAGAVAGGYRALGGAVAGDPNSGEKGQALAQEMTYQPQTEVAKSAVQTAAIPSEKIAQGADVVGRNVADVTGSPALGAATNTATQAAGQILLGKGAGIVGEATGISKALAGNPTRGAVTVRSAVRAAPPVNLAKDFVTNKLKMKWEDLPKGIQKKLRTAARDPAELNKLDAEQVKVEARAERLNMPVTRGDVTKNPAQVGSESRISKSEGNPVSVIKAAQDKALHTALDDVRESTGATAQTRGQVGKSVQDDSLRAKESASKEHYDERFKNARATEPTAAVSPQPLYDLLEQRPHLQRLGFVESWLKKAKAKTEEEGPGSSIVMDTNVGKALKKGKAETHTELRNMPLTEVEDLRVDAAGVAAKGGTDGYYAGQIVNAIDKMYETIPKAAKAWREARDAFKAHKIEFEDQQIVRDLSGDKTRTDRTVDLEDTTTKVLSKGAEDIAKLKKTMTNGGTDKTRAAGEQGWKNLQAGVIDFLREKAHGRRANVNENRQAEFNAAYRDAFGELDKDGKIDIIFDKPQAAKLREIYEAVGDVRQQPSSRIHGSDTAANLEAQKIENTLSRLEKIAELPVVGPPIAGTVGVARQIWDAGSAPRASARAKTTPLSEASETAKRNRAKLHKRFGTTAPKKKSRNTLKSLRTGASAAGRMTLQDQNSDQR